MNDKLNQLYNEVKNIVGEPLYLVGGSVRDVLLNKEPKDYDFTTPLLPEAIETRIKNAGRHVYLTGKRFGTIGVKVDGQLIEVTTFRTEKYEDGSRKPEVEFTETIDTDLSRRDFTINAIAWRPGRLIDPFKGELDLKDGIIRAVGNPTIRFKEDPLRLLRAVRFASQFNFKIEETTLKSLEKHSYKILQISKERWMQELDKIFLSDHPEYGLELLARTRLLNYMIPELALQVGYVQHSKYHNHTLFVHTQLVTKAVPKDINLRWAAVLHDIAKPFVRTEKENIGTIFFTNI